MLVPHTDGTIYPGSYPVTVTPRRGGSDPIPVTGPHAYWFDTPQKGGFDISGAELGDGWLVFCFEGYNDGVSPGRPQRVTVPVQAALTAVPNADPALATDGYKVRPGTRGHNFYFGATAGGLINIWARSKGGLWVNGGTLSQIDPTQEGIAYRDVLIHADRVYLRSLNAGTTVAIDADMEIG